MRKSGFIGGILILIMVAAFVLSGSEKCLAQTEVSVETSRGDGLTAYNEAISAHKPIIVEYYTNWCYYCRQLAPILEDLKKKWGDRVVFVRLNADQQANKEMVRKAGVKGYPTMQFIGKDGRVKSTLPGAYPKSEIEKELEKIAK